MRGTWTTQCQNVNVKPTVDSCLGLPDYTRIDLIICVTDHEDRLPTLCMGAHSKTLDSNVPVSLLKSATNSGSPRTFSGCTNRTMSWKRAGSNSQSIVNFFVSRQQSSSQTAEGKT